MQKIFVSSAQTEGYPGYPEKSGQIVEAKVICYDMVYGEMFRIVFEDGTETVAYQDELS